MLYLLRLIIPALLMLVTFQLSAQQAVLIKDLETSNARLTLSHSSTSLNGKLIFAYTDQALGEEAFVLKEKDNTPLLLKDINPGAAGSRPREFTRVNDLVFFIADSINIPQLWVTDGTLPGTRQIRVTPKATANLRTLTVLGNKVVFKRRVENLETLYVSDGTNAGTKGLTSYTTDGSFHFPDRLAVFKNKVYFSGNHGSADQWISDGTVSGTRKLTASEPSIPPLHYSFNGRAYYGIGFADDALVSDGTAAGTSTFPAKIKSVNPGKSAVVFHGALYFIGSTSTESGLYRVDSLGAIHLVSINNTDKILAINDNHMLLSSSDSKLWVSDGTQAGTTPIKTLSRNGFTYKPTYADTLADGRFIIAGMNNTGFAIDAIWISDGTTDGTVDCPVETIGTDKAVFAGMNTNLFVPALGTCFLWSGYKDYTLYYFDSDTHALLPVVKPMITESASPGGFFRYNDMVIFSALSQQSGYKLWKTSGGAENTELIEPESEYTFSTGEKIVFNGTVYFVKNTLTSGREVWRTDGTEANTSILKDIVPGPGDSYPKNFFIFKDRLYFWTVNVVVHELWSTDGTVEGTQKAASVRGPVNGLNLNVQEDFFYYLGQNPATSQLTLMKSDGTESGTVTLHTFALIDYYGDNYGNVLYPMGDAIFFLAGEDMTGIELWKMDLATEEVTKVRDINPGVDTGSARIITATDDKIFFTKNDGTHGIELWVSDGTESGTHIVKDINPGSGSMQVSGYAVYHDKLYFSSFSSPGFIPSTWVTDGTEEGTTTFITLSPGENSFHNYFVTHDLLLITRNGKIYRSEGTEATTTEIVTGVSFDYNYTNFYFFEFNDLVLFSGYTPAVGGELWALDFRSEEQTIDFEVADDKAYGDPDFELTATASSGLPITFSSLNTNRVTIAGNIAQIKAGGEVVLRASQGGNSLLKSAHKDVTITIARLPQEVTFDALDPVAFSKRPLRLTASSSTGLKVKFESSDESILEFVNGEGYMKSLGEVVVTAVQQGNAEYEPATASQLLVIQKGGQIIIGPESISVPFSTTPYTFPVVADSGLPLAFESEDTEIISIENGKGIFHRAGTAVVQVAQSGNDLYDAAARALTITVTKISPALEFDEIAPQGFSSGLIVALHATALAGGTITYSSLDTELGTVEANNLLVLKPGEIRIVATRAEDDIYVEESVTQTIVISKMQPQITFNPAASVTYATDSLTLAATSTSPLPITFTSADPATLFIKGNKAITKKGGTVAITAVQAGNEFYAAQSVERSISISKAQQTVTVAIPARVKFNVRKIRISGTSTSGLPITYTSSATDVVSVKGDSLIFKNAGASIITATQPGDERYLEKSVSQTLVIEKGIQQISFDAIEDVDFASSTLVVHAKATSGLPVIYTSASVHVTVSGATLTFLSPGTVTIRATQSGNSNYENAFAEETFCIIPVKPVLTYNASEGALISSATGTHRWYRNSQLIKDETKNTIVLKAGGEYTAQVTSEGCTSDLSESVMMLITTVEKRSQERWTIYPNPAMQFITVSSTDNIGNGDLQVTLYDMQGKKVLEDSNPINGLINIESLAPGIYYIIINDGKRHSQTFKKKN